MVTFNIQNNELKTEEQPHVIAIADTTDYMVNDHEYSFLFNAASVDNAKSQTIIIGNAPDVSHSDTLSIFKNGLLLTTLNFQYAYHSSSTKEAVKLNRFVAIGLSGYFYLYDLSTYSIKLFIDLEGYFNSFTLYKEWLLVAYNSGIYCLDKFGRIKWHNSSIGIDGVLIRKVEGDKVYGQEQVDPPDGWDDFILDMITGSRVSD